MFQSRTLVGLDRKLSNVKRGEQGTCSSEIWMEGARSVSLDIRAQHPCPFPTSVTPRGCDLRAQELMHHTRALPYLPDPDLVDYLIPVVGQEGPHIGQEGSCKETVSHQVAQILLQALEDSRGGKYSLPGPHYWRHMDKSEGTLPSGHCPDQRESFPLLNPCAPRTQPYPHNF